MWKKDSQWRRPLWSPGREVKTVLSRGGGRKWQSTGRGSATETPKACRCAVGGRGGPLGARGGGACMAYRGCPAGDFLVSLAHMLSWACMCSLPFIPVDALWPKKALLSFHNAFLKLHFFSRMAVSHWRASWKERRKEEKSSPVRSFSRHFMATCPERELLHVPCFLSPIFFGIG